MNKAIYGYKAFD